MGNNKFKNSSNTNNLCCQPKIDYKQNIEPCY